MGARVAGTGRSTDGPGSILRVPPGTGAGTTAPTLDVVAFSQLCAEIEPRRPYPGAGFISERAHPGGTSEASSSTVLGEG